MTARLDWKRPGLFAWQRRVAYCVVETLLADEDEQGALIPGGAAACTRAVDAIDDSFGRGSGDLRRGFVVLCLFMQWLPFFMIDTASRMTRLSLADRIRYLEALESSRIGWATMLLVAFKVPMCIPAFEEGEELAETGFDRPSTESRRRLPMTEGAP